MRKLLTEKWIEPSYIDEYGSLFWCNKYGNLHSNRDKPAVIWLTGEKFWHKNGQLHRDGNKPSITCLNGEKHWHKNGKQHRDGNEPAIIYSNGKKLWYKNGVFIK